METKDIKDTCDAKAKMEELDLNNRTGFDRIREMISNVADTKNRQGLLVGLVESNDRRIAKIRAELRSLKFEQHYYRNELKKLDARDFEDNGDGKDV